MLTGVRAVYVFRSLLGMAAETVRTHLVQTSLSGVPSPINTGSDHECRARQKARRAASDPRCGAGTWNVCQVCVWLVDHDSSPSKKKPRLRMIRLIPADILCRRLRLFIRAVFWDTASALISERRGSSCDSGVQTAVGCIDVPDAWTGAGG